MLKKTDVTALREKIIKFHLPLGNDENENFDFIPKDNQIIFLEPHNSEITKYIEDNISKLQEQFNKVIVNDTRCEFIFLGSQGKSKRLERQFYNYNYPYLSRNQRTQIQSVINVLSLKHVTNFITRKYKVEVERAGLIRFNNKEQNISYFEFENDGKDYLDSIFRTYLTHLAADALPRFVKASIRSIKSETDLIMLDADFGNLDVDSLDTVKDKFSFKNSIESELDQDTIVLKEEIQKKISTLIANGRDQLAISIALDILKFTTNPSKKELSKLKITSDFKIILEDYSKVEIRLTPLQKSLYILFLKHEKGINLKYLGDHKKELFEIYKTLSNRLSYSSVNQSINDLIDPTSNSINEKISKIKDAFISKFNKDISKHYYLTGSRGEPKKIQLPRDLVIWETNSFSIQN